MSPKRSTKSSTTASKTYKGNPSESVTKDSEEALPQDESQQGPVELPPITTVGELSQILNRTNVDTIKALMRIGVMATVNERVEFDIAAQVADMFDIPVLKPRDSRESSASLRSSLDNQLSHEKNATARPPIITVLGHVDHGKTTLLDAIRGANTVENEVGGITQNIGAYQINKEGNLLTFIDTPGHEAFTSMRASGAQVTDIAVVVVAADDGVMPQTVEAIDHAKAANVPIVIAINKMDLQGADPDRLKGELAEHDVIVEDYGGDTVSVPISAIDGNGVDDLVEAILLVAELQELKADHKRSGIGVVIEAHMDRSRGPIATVLVRSGTVNRGDTIVAGIQKGRVRAMTDGLGNSVKSAEPSTPVQILGFSGLPLVGDQFDVVEDDRSARQVVENRKRIQQRSTTNTNTTMADVMRRVNSGDAEELNVIVKSNTQGSVDAVKKSVEQLSNTDVQVVVIHAGAGRINESDILLASASDALVVGFETNIERGASSQAEVHNVLVKSYDIIYNLIDDVKSIVAGKISPEEEHIVRAKANVLQVFPRGKREKIAGVRVTDGLIKRNHRIRVLRGDNEVFDGAIASMRHLTDNVRELANNFEGGIILDGFHDYEEGDLLEVYEIVKSN